MILSRHELSCMHLFIYRAMILRKGKIMFQLSEWIVLFLSSSATHGHVSSCHTQGQINQIPNHN